MDVNDQKAFRAIAEKVLGKGHVCVDGGTHWHLVIETLCTDSTLEELGYTVSDLKPEMRPKR
jgi:hypothetical protein